MDRDTAIEIKDVSKSYKSVKALRDISFNIRKGELFGLIGPDGAGKTTLFRILTTLTLPDSGSATVIGLDVVRDYREIRGRIGYMPGHFALYQDLTVEENLKFHATMFGTTIDENYETIKGIYSQIEMFKDRKASALSGGMKQKLALCCALVHDPEVLFLDEPTTGVDAVSRKEFWAMLKKIKDRGVTIVVSTPYMDEASLCDRIAMILDGSVIGLGSPAEIISRFPNRIYSVSGGNMFQTLGALRGVRGVLDCSSFGSACHVSVTDGRMRPDSPRLFGVPESKVATCGG